MEPSDKTVLLVDDEPSLLKMMSVYLKRRGYRVLTYHSTDAAWQDISQNPGSVRMAVLDLTMPGLSTTDLALRLLAANPELRVLVASGYPTLLEDLEKAAPGRVMFLHKPFTPKMLDACLRRLLG